MGMLGLGPGRQTARAVAAALSTASCSGVTRGEAPLDRSGGRRSGAVVDDVQVVERGWPVGELHHLL